MNGELSYHRHLDEISRADVEYVRVKDAQYAASWKRREGPGAFFTFARPWDRLESMAQRPRTITAMGVTTTPVPYDVFGIIEAEGMHGEDGTLIACVRDLRRYLLLLEAEMTERLLKKYAALNKANELPEMNYADIEQRIIAWAAESNASGDPELNDIYLRIAEEVGMTRQQVKEKVYRAVYGGDLMAKELGELEPTRGDAAHLSDDVEEKVNTFPFVTTWGGLSYLGPEAWDAWTKMSPSVHVLQARLEPEMWLRLPPQVQSAYRPIYLSEDQPFGGEAQLYVDEDPSSDLHSSGPTAFWLRIEQAPESERDRWRHLAREQNYTEWKGLMEYGELYAWFPSLQKMILREAHEGWKRQ